MNNFIFENKTKVYFGKGCVGEYLPKIAAVHGDKVLLAYGGGSIKKNGVYEEVIAALEKAGKTIIEFPGIKVRANASERADLISLADIFRAKIVDVEKDCLMIELTGTESKLKAFMELLEGYEILELARTGITGLKRGSDDVIMFD